MPNPSIVEQCVPDAAKCSLDVVIEKFGTDNLGQCKAPLEFLDQCRPEAGWKYCFFDLYVFEGDS